jgi:ribosome-binding protein aMBF1 (putative translation factor)
MYGDCEICGTKTHDLDCAYNDSTGEELYVCPYCAEHINDKDDDE